MRSLFLKIFLSFWLANALLVVLVILVTAAMRPARQISAIEALQPKFLTEAMETYQSGGVERLRDYIRNLRETQHVRAVLYNEQGNLVGHPVPPWFDEVASGRGHTTDTLLGRLNPRQQMLKASIEGSDGHRYTLVTELPRDQVRGVFGPNGVPGLAILIGVLSSGLVCYFLSGYLTSPIVRLRKATQKLASGDLSARAGGATGAKDEVSQLVRDFDLMAEQIENLVRAQSRLFKDISHELRSPLARLTVALELARQRSAPEVEPILDRISLESSRLNDLIGSLMTIARLESGRGNMRRVPIYLQDIVEEVARDAAFEAQARNCWVQADIQDELPVVGDPALLHSAIENVVRNATRYTREGTTVKVYAGKIHSWNLEQAVIRVTDAGPGVPEESLDKIFRPFYRIDDARGRTTGGVGLGLAITEQAIRLHGGSVKASNLAEGGLLVEIRFPLESVEAPRSQPAPVTTANQ